MHFCDSFTSADYIPPTKVITMEGEGQSGKGTSAAALEQLLHERDSSVLVIDQGQKFRVMTHLALQHPRSVELLADQQRLGDFLQSDDTRDQALNMLGELAAIQPKQLRDEKIKKLLRTDPIQAAVKEIGKNPNSHEFAVGLMFGQVRNAVAAETDTVIIDGRCMQKYGIQIAQQKIAQFVMGFYFQCDAATSGRRNMNKIKGLNDLDQAGMNELLKQIIAVSDRNRDDTHRDTDPMFPPSGAYALDLHNFKTDDERFVYRQTLAAMRCGAVLLNTSYTESIEEMTGPVTAIAMTALELHDEERQRFRIEPALWRGYLPFDDPEATEVLVGRSDFRVSTVPS